MPVVIFVAKLCPMTSEVLLIKQSKYTDRYCAPVAKKHNIPIELVNQPNVSQQYVEAGE
jgi:hypothetical protein